jgi:hypothetical protein
MSSSPSSPDRRVKDALEYIHEQVAARATEMRALMDSANGLARAAGLPLPYPELELGEPAAMPTRPTPADAAGLAVHKTVRAGQFANHRTPSAAIRAYLEWRGPRGRGVTIDEIMRALSDGGFAFDHGAERARHALRAAVVRDPDVIRSKSGLYALARWAKRR